jgi:sporulation protein YlmC with PRC-barrel domain
VIFLQTNEQLFASRVVGIEGFDIGQIKDFDVDFNTWKITSIIIALSSEATEKLGLKRRIFTPRICVPIAAVDTTEGKIHLNKSLKELYNADPGILECPREALL